MGNHFLLTYIRKGSPCFQWFETLNEMDKFVDEVCMTFEYKVLEKIQIKEAVIIV